MMSRNVTGRAWTSARAVPGTFASAVYSGGWARGVLHTGGQVQLHLPPGGTGFGYAFDPSDPRTWRRPVVFT